MRSMILATMLVLAPLAAHAENWQEAGVDQYGTVVKIDVDSVVINKAGGAALKVMEGKSRYVAFYDCKGHVNGQYIFPGMIAADIQKAVCSSHLPSLSMDDK